MLRYFNENSLKLNFDKSSYFILNPKPADQKTSLQLDGGMLKYKSVQDYLGVYVTDCGILKQDVTKFIREKRSNVLIKFTNFCSKNFLAPLGIKLDVLDSCVASSLLYASETWMDCGKEAEVIYRNGLRAALGIRSNINNEIVYIESGRYPLKCRILKLQLKFWLSLQTYCDESPDSALKHFLDVAKRIELPYVKWYMSLEEKYGSPNNCQKMLEAEYAAKWRTTFDNNDDNDSRLGTYLQVNPTLSSPEYLKAVMFETDRLILTRFRCGSHSLAIEKGRYSNTPREERLCSCGEVQTIFHCFTSCPDTQHLLNGKVFTSLHDVFQDENFCLLTSSNLVLCLNNG